MSEQQSELEFYREFYQRHRDDIHDYELQYQKLRAQNAKLLAACEAMLAYHIWATRGGLNDPEPADPELMCQVAIAATKPGAEP